VGEEGDELGLEGVETGDVETLGVVERLEVGSGEVKLRSHGERPTLSRSICAL